MSHFMRITAYAISIFKVNQSIGNGILYSLFFFLLFVVQNQIKSAFMASVITNSSKI